MRRIVTHAISIALAGTSALSAAPPAQPTFSIGAITDCQYADEPDAPPRLYHTCPTKFAEAVTALNKEHVRTVLHLGDFIDKDWTSFDRLMPIVARSRHPWHFVLGNHDYAVDGPHKAKVPARLGMKARYYSLTAPGWLFLITDGNGLSTYAVPDGSAEQAAAQATHDRLYPNQPLWDGGIDQPQLAWLETMLAKADRKGLRVMIVDHFPVWPASRYTLWNAAELLAMIDRHPSVKIWLNGHDHRGGYATRRGIHYVTMAAMLDTEETAFAQLDFYPDHISLRGRGKQSDIQMPIH